MQSLGKKKSNIAHAPLENNGFSNSSYGLQMLAVYCLFLLGDVPANF